MNKNNKAVAKILGKRPRDVDLSDLQLLIGQPGTIPGLRNGLPRRRCVVKSIEMSKKDELQVVVQIGRRLLKRPISKFQLLTNQDKERDLAKEERRQASAARLEEKKKLKKAAERHRRMLQKEEWERARENYKDSYWSE